MIKNKIIVCWFSCGLASAVAAKKTIDKYGKDCQIRVVNNPIAEEHPDNKRFLKDVEQWIGTRVEYAINPKYPSCSIRKVWQRRKYMSGINGAPCTTELKKKARQHWENNNKYDYMVLGFTYDEKKRHDRFILTERNNLLPILIESKITKEDCAKIIQDAGIDIPKMYKLGYPNANCIGCVKATSPSYWNLVRTVHPQVFAERRQQSNELGVKLVRIKGKRCSLDELKTTDVGRPLKSLDFDCSSFCEESFNAAPSIIS